MYPTIPSLYLPRFTSIATDILKEKITNEHALQGFFLEEFPISLWG